MDYTTYEVEARVEQFHWWFVGRRKLFKSVIAGIGLDTDAAILDIGTGTGTNLRMLRELGFSNVRGIDMYDEAIRWCAEKGLGRVDQGDICNIPASAASYDLVLATDIIEHVDEDRVALQEIARVLRPNGAALITVPAFQTLWGLQDTVSQHKRRYTKRDLVEKLGQSSLSIKELFYFNYLLFLPIWTARTLIRIMQPNLKSENELNSRFINRVLQMIFFLDVLTARHIRPPFGVSLLAVVKKER